MDRGEIAFWIGVAMAPITIGLAALKVYEVFRDRRPKLSAAAILRGDEQHGHEVVLLNASKVPAGIYHYDVVRAKRSFLGKNVALGRRMLSVEVDLEDTACNIVVPPHSQTILPFAEQYYFAWGQIKHDVYLRLWMVGRRNPLWLWITGPDR